MKAALRPFVFIYLMALSILLIACAGLPKGSGTGTGTGTGGPFTIGGTLTGLATGSSVIMQDNGADNLTVTANGPFAFKTSIATGGAFAVTVFTQPTNPGQTCTVAAGTGTVTANVT